MGALNDVEVWLHMFVFASCWCSFLGVCSSSFLPNAFEFPNFATNGEWLIDYNDNFPQYYNKSARLSPDPERTLTNKAKDTVGRLVYNQSIRFKTSDSSGQVASFCTSFTFQFITTEEYGDAGDGLAFFIAPLDYANPMINSSYGEYLGIANVTQSSDLRLFAVEFDTFQNKNLNDTSASHIGIDINGLISINTTDTSSRNSTLYLYNNYTFTAWVDYNASTSLIEVRMTSNSSKARPSEPCLQAQYNLSTIFLQEMYVGLSASTGDAYQGCVIYSWDFTADFVSTGSKSFHTLILAVAVGLPCLLVLLAVIAVWNIPRGKCALAPRSLQPGQESFNTIIDIPLNPAVPRYSYEQLRRATHGFSGKAKIGEGGFSSVYKGTLRDGSQVAVKRLNKEGLRKKGEFSSEIRIISNAHHSNLLQLKGWCYEREEAMLVYEFMPNGSLDTYLFGKKKGQLVNSETRLGILKGVAAALDHLHTGMPELVGSVLHRDVKAANVLLTDDFDAMLGDFGLARLLKDNQDAVTMTAAGTPGYVAPELVISRTATDKVDVYSFGIMALEVACGRCAFDARLQPQERSLLDWVWLLHQSNLLGETLDQSMVLQAQRRASSNANDIDDDNIQVEHELMKWTCVLHLALRCCHPLAEARPSMREVHQTLDKFIVLPLPEFKPFYPIPNINISLSSCFSHPSF